MNITFPFSLTSDSDLDSVVTDIQAHFPGWGNRQVYGCLVSRGTRIYSDSIFKS